MKKQNYSVIVKCNLEYVFKASSAKEAYRMAQEVELPKEYVEDSFEIIQITDEKNKIFYHEKV